MCLGQFVFEKESLAEKKLTKKNNYLVYPIQVFIQNIFMNKQNLFNMKDAFKINYLFLMEWVLISINMSFELCLRNRNNYGLPLT